MQSRSRLYNQLEDILVPQPQEWSRLSVAGLEKWLGLLYGLSYIAGERVPVEVRFKPTVYPKVDEFDDVVDLVVKRTPWDCRLDD
jgi:hypothetical protein